MTQNYADYGTQIFLPSQVERPPRRLKQKSKLNIIIVIDSLSLVAKEPALQVPSWFGCGQQNPKGQ